MKKSDSNGESECEDKFITLTINIKREFFGNIVLFSAISFILSIYVFHTLQFVNECPFINNIRGFEKEETLTDLLFINHTLTEKTKKITNDVLIEENEKEKTENEIKPQIEFEDPPNDFECELETIEHHDNTRTENENKDEAQNKKIKPPVLLKKTKSTMSDTLNYFVQNLKWVRPSELDCYFKAEKEKEKLCIETKRQ